MGDNLGDLKNHPQGHSHPQNVPGALNVDEESLRLDMQICFPLYAAARLMMQFYKPYLDPLGLTYPQYLVMLVLWEQDALSVKEIGSRLHLDSATVIQILVNLEKQSLIERRRVSPKGDGRIVLSYLTKNGRELKKSALGVVQGISCDLGGDFGEIENLRAPLFKFLHLLQEKLSSST